MIRISLIGVLFLACMAPTFAQEKIADKIVAIVGKRIILESDVNQQYESEKINNPNLADSARCDIFYTLVAQQILIEQAGRDSIIVTEDEVNSILDQRIRYWINQYGGKENLEAASNKTIYQIKEDYRDFFKDKAIAEQMQSSIMKNVKVTPVEVEEFFNTIPKDSLPPIPASVEIGQIIINPTVNPEVDALTKEKLEGIRKDIVDGKNTFATMASIYSVDGSRQEGGLLTINRTNFDPQFVAAAYRLQPGEISPIVKSKFGYHIIKMEKRMGEEAIVRHILLVPEATSIDIERTKKKMDSIRVDLMSNKLTFSEAVGKYSTDEQSKMTGGMMADDQGRTNLPLEALPDALTATTITGLAVGEFSQPQVFDDHSKSAKGVRILYLKSRTNPHVLNLKDDYSYIQQIALNNKQHQHLHNWLGKHIDGYYIKIDPEYQNCEQVKGWDNSTANK